jgi:hypothetical protein
MSDMANAAIVQTDSGPVRGIVTDECRLFQGIPYAASTGGNHRWRSPQPVQAWSELRDATKPGNISAQQPSVYADVASPEEDCLFLNVTTPRWSGADRLRRVMVWIHGDGAIGGGSFRCSPARDHRRRRRGDDQLSAWGLRDVRLLPTGRLGNLRHPGPAGGIGVGSAQRRGIRGGPQGPMSAEA